MPLSLPHRTLVWNHRPLVMGILNVTPDSFSDGGRFLAHDDAVAHAEAMIGQGADIIDVGPESTRPGAASVSPDEQIERAIPVIKTVRGRHDTAVISIDTRSARVAAAALQAGAEIVNDVSALRDDPDMASLVARQRAGVVLMHMRGTPADMQAGGGPHYDDVVGEILEFLRERTECAVHAGIDPARIVVDPGIGFGKRPEHNLSLIKHLHRFTAGGVPVLVGASRKRFIGAVLRKDDAAERNAGSLAVAILAAIAGVAMLRVHDVRATVEAFNMLAAVRAAR